MRRITGVLSGDERTRFERAAKEKSFPQVYGESMADSAFERTLSLGDLTADQRATVEAIRDSYLDRREPMDEEWAEAIVDDRKDRKGLTQFDDEYFQDEDGNFKQPRSMELWMERFELDREALAELYGALDGSQRMSARVMDPKLMGFEEQTQEGEKD